MANVKSAHHHIDPETGEAVDFATLRTFAQYWADCEEEAKEESWRLDMEACRASEAARIRELETGPAWYQEEVRIDLELHEERMMDLEERGIYKRTSDGLPALNDLNRRTASAGVWTIGAP